MENNCTERGGANYTWCFIVSHDGKGDTSYGSVLFDFHILAIRSMPTDLHPFYYITCKTPVACVEYSYGFIKISLPACSNTRKLEHFHAVLYEDN